MSRLLGPRYGCGLIISFLVKCSPLFRGRSFEDIGASGFPSAGWFEELVADIADFVCLIRGLVSVGGSIDLLIGGSATSALEPAATESAGVSLRLTSAGALCGASIMFGAKLGCR